MTVPQMIVVDAVRAVLYERCKGMSPEDEIAALEIVRDDIEEYLKALRGRQ